MKKLIAWLKSLFKRKPKSARVIVVNGRSVYITNDDRFTIENGVVRHKDPNVVIRPTIIYSSVQQGTLGDNGVQCRCEEHINALTGVTAGVFIGGVAASLSNECSHYDDYSSGSDSGSNGSADVADEAVMTENDDVKMDVSIEWFDPVSQGYSWTINVRFPTLDVESLIGHEAFTPYPRIDSLPTTKVIDPTKH